MTVYIVTESCERHNGDGDCLVNTQIIGPFATEELAKQNIDAWRDAMVNDGMTDVSDDVTYTYGFAAVEDEASDGDYYYVRALAPYHVAGTTIELKA